ncbi:MAG: hypothetical protein AAF480_14140 [Actinomycetota bacterium]
MREVVANPWRTEIDELHAFFEAYFLGAIPREEIGRVERALARDFTILGPHGAESDRKATIAAIEDGHAHTDSLEITVTEHRLIASTEDHVVATYVENHRLTDRTNHRVATVVFTRDPDGPNGLRWVRVQETWRAS